MVQVQVERPHDGVMADGVIDDNDYNPIVNIVNKGIAKGDIRQPSNWLRRFELVALGAVLCLGIQWAYGWYYRPSYVTLNADYSELVASLVNVCGVANNREACNILSKNLLYRPATSNLTASVEGH